MREPMLLIAALLGASGVGLGAFGAHALKARLGASAGTWDTAVTYHLIHAVALLGVAILFRSAGDAGLLRAAGWSMTVGVLLFSGSLYVLALGGPRWLGPVTPMGGLGFIVGWLLLAVWAWRASA
ncbi:MAG TPA: DUF423 domain-containing protein [Pseudomonadales bacterium]|nr:DUF423 domain-containing protein [Pseudomonadales bacterium]